MLTGRARKGRQTDLVRATYFKALSDERRLDAVEQLIPLADEVGLPMTHLAMAFATAHPSADIGTLDQAYVPPAIQLPSLRRRRAEQRAAA